LSTIRPQANPYPQPQFPNGANPGRLSAQQAFFALAGLARPTAAPTAPQAASPAPATVASVASPAATASEAAQKILRPGSLIDIRV